MFKRKVENSGLTRAEVSRKAPPEAGRCHLKKISNALSIADF
jgi:hypothetical protein